MASSEERTTSFVSPDTELKGELHSQETLKVCGKVKGKVVCRTQLSIGQEGQVEAEVDSPRVIIEGKLRGDLRAPRQLEILKGAEFFGKLAAQPELLVLSPEARFAENEDALEK